MVRQSIHSQDTLEEGIFLLSGKGTKKFATTVILTT